MKSRFWMPLLASATCAVVILLGFVTGASVRVVSLASSVVFYDCDDSSYYDGNGVDVLASPNLND